MLALGLLCLAGTIHGIYLAFSVNWIMGIVFLICEPLPLVTSVVYWLADINIAQKLLELFTM